MVPDPKNAADPLQPGDPFKKKNFIKFTFGMMAFMVLFGALVLLYFLFGHRRVPHTSTRSTHSHVLPFPTTSFSG